jgi:hypothetical protein
MNRQQVILLIVALSLIGGTAGLLARVGTRQRLGPPAVTTSPSSDPKRLKVELPERVLDFKSEWFDPDDVTKGTLPPDTSFGQRRYDAPDGFSIMVNVVLMGMDRTSLHKPQFCLEGQGWHIDPTGTLETSVHVDQPVAYDLPIARLIANKTAAVDGEQQAMRGVYTYWFVADNAFSASITGFDRMWMMGSKLLQTGVLQRWAYVSCFSPCRPGEETAVFERTKKFIAAAVPGFQLTPRAGVTRAGTP